MERRLLLSQVIIAFVLTIQAQTNPCPGYIITNENDTVFGVIDFRSDAKNAKSCLFSNSEDANFREYFPQQVKGYRLLDYGTFYVSRTFEVDGDERTFFAELLLQGPVSLYRLRQGETDYFFLVDPDGQVGTVRENHDLHQLRDDQIAAQRLKVGDATHIFQRSQESLNKLWKTYELTPEVMTQLTLDYNQTIYADQGENIVFEQGDRTTSSFKAHIRVEAGVGINQMTIYPFIERNPTIEMTALSPMIGIGADMLLPRVSKHLIAQAMLYYSYNKASKDTRDVYVQNAYINREVSFHDFALQAGIAYNFLPDSHLSPIVRGGVSFNYLLGMSTKRLVGYYNTEKFEQDNTVSFRYYAGAGLEYAIGSHKISLTGNYVMRNYGTFGFKAPMITINCGFIF